MANKILLKDSKVLIDADKKILTADLPVVEGELTITENGAYDVSSYKTANVEVEDLYQKRFNEYNGYGLFAYYYGTSLDEYIAKLDLSSLTNCNHMFRDCTYLQTIPQLDTSNVTNMQQMFAYCNELQTIPQLDTTKVYPMSYAFRSCYILQKIDITSMDKIITTSNSSAMCDKCYSLTKFIIRTMTKTPALNSSAFTNCYHFTGTVNSTYNPDGLKDGRIYVPDDYVDTLKAATNWSTYADIIVPLSTLEE